MLIIDNYLSLIHLRCRDVPYIVSLNFVLLNLRGFRIIPLPDISYFLGLDLLQVLLQVLIASGSKDEQIISNFVLVVD